MASGQIYSLIMMIVVLGTMVVIVGGIIGVIVWMNKASREAQAGPWRALAQQHGGAFTPSTGMFGSNRIVFVRPFGQLVLETKTLSVMDAVASPYRFGTVGTGAAGHNDGGTYTHARARYARSNGPACSATPSRAQQVPLFAGIQSVSAFSESCAIFSSPQEVVLVMPGAVTNAGLLNASLHFVSAVAERVAAS